MVALPNGQVLVASGQAETNSQGLTSELYDPATGEWTLVNSLMSTARRYHRASLLNDGRVLISGGNNYHLTGGGGISYGVTDLCEIYDPATDSINLSSG